MKILFTIILALTPLLLNAQNKLCLHQENSKIENRLSKIQRITFDKKGNLNLKLSSSITPEDFIIEQINFLSFSYENWNSISQNQLSSKNNSIHIFPNPVENVLFIKSDLDNISSLRLFNYQGKLIKEYKSIDDLKGYDVSELPSGLYICQIDNEGKLTSEVFIKR